MHDNFESLLKRCKTYQRKRVLTRLAWMSMIFVVLSGLLWLYQYRGFLHEETPVVSVEKTIPLAITSPKVETMVQASEVEVVQAQVLETKEDELKAAQKSSDVRKDVAYELNVDESYLTSMSQKENQKTPKVIAKPKVLKKTELPKEPLEKPLHVMPKTSQQILTVSTKKLVSIDDLSAQYDKEPQYDLALKISQAYYDDNKFSKASTWAKKANMIDRERDGAWMMYAKSEYARGNKDRAKDILSLYLANKRSKDIEILLMSWNQEK
jgi:tetratricopeptide (TPR) repeat protein